MAHQESSQVGNRRAFLRVMAGAATDGEATEAYRELLEQFGPTEFLGYIDYEAKARILEATDSAHLAGRGGRASRRGPTLPNPWRDQR